MIFKNSLKKTVTNQKRIVQFNDDKKQYFHLGFVPDANLKRKLSNKNIKIKGIKVINIEKRFDIIILSNVPAFLNKIYKSDFLKNFRNLIDGIKNSNTKIVVCYLYSNLLESGSSKDDIYNNRKLREYFPNDEYEYMHFESSNTLGSKSGLKKIFPKFDSVFISK